MEKQKDFRQQRFHRLLEFMSDVGYARYSIACVKDAIEKMASRSVTPTTLDYEEAISRAVGYGRKRAMRIVRDFDLDENFPVVNYKRPLKESVYASLPSEFKNLRESYPAIALARGLEPETVKIYKAVTSAFLLYMSNHGRTCFREITEDDIHSYFTQGKIGGDQCRYIKSVLQDCIPVSAGCELERIIRILPKIPRSQKVCDFLTDSEVKALRDVIMSDDKLSLRNRSICILAMFAGLRSTDIANLKFCEVDWEKDEICLVQSKTRSIVRVPIIPVVGNLLFRYITEERPEYKSDRIFLTESKWVRPMKGREVYDVSVKLYRLAGIRQDGRRRGLHLLRHHLAASMLQSGTDMSVISSVLGHRSPQTVESYLSCNTELLRRCAISIEDYPVNSKIYMDDGTDLL